MTPMKDEMIMAKVKEFPFGSLGVVRLLQELREELNLPFADIERFEEAEKRLGQSLKSMGQTAGRGAAEARQAETKIIRQAADNLSAAVKDAADNLKKADRDGRKQATDALRSAVRQASKDMKALSEVAQNAHSQTVSDLSAQVKSTIADLKALARPEKPGKTD